MDEFYRIKRLPPYVFTIVNDLKSKARAQGEDIIDLGMGNPDQGTPKHIVDKLCEAARNPRNHRYSASRGITRQVCTPAGLAARAPRSCRDHERCTGRAACRPYISHDRRTGTGGRRPGSGRRRLRLVPVERHRWT